MLETGAPPRGSTDLHTRILKTTKKNKRVTKMKYAPIALLLVLALASTACVHKKNKAGTALPDGDNVGQFDGGLDIIGYDQNGNPIYADGASDMMRLDGAELGAGQFEAVYFDYDSPQLNPAEQDKINAVVTYLQQNPSMGVVVEGHCDERGSNEYNLSLGERRALAVRAAVVSGGIDGTRVQTSSRGEESPAAMGHDESSWRLNRRAEFVLTQM